MLDLLSLQMTQVLRLFLLIDSPYVNVIAVNEGNQDLPKIKALVEALKGDEVKAYVAERYPNGEVVLVD